MSPARWIGSVCWSSPQRRFDFFALGYGSTSAIRSSMDAKPRSLTITTSGTR